MFSQRSSRDNWAVAHKDEPTALEVLNYEKLKKITAKKKIKDQLDPLDQKEKL